MQKNPDKVRFAGEVVDPEELEPPKKKDPRGSLCRLLDKIFYKLQTHIDLKLTNIISVSCSTTVQVNGRSHTLLFEIADHVVCTKYNRYPIAVSLEQLKQYKLERFEFMTDLLIESARAQCLSKFEDHCRDLRSAVNICDTATDIIFRLRQGFLSTELKDGEFTFWRNASNVEKPFGVPEIETSATIRRNSAGRSRISMKSPTKRERGAGGFETHQSDGTGSSGTTRASRKRPRAEGAGTGGDQAGGPVREATAVSETNCDEESDSSSDSDTGMVGLHSGAPATEESRIDHAELDSEYDSDSSVEEIDSGVGGCYVNSKGRRCGKQTREKQVHREVASVDVIRRERDLSYHLIQGAVPTAQHLWKRFKANDDQIKTGMVTLFDSDCSSDVSRAFLVIDIKPCNLRSDENENCVHLYEGFWLHFGHSGDSDLPLPQPWRRASNLEKALSSSSSSHQSSSSSESTSSSSSSSSSSTTNWLSAQTERAPAECAKDQSQYNNLFAYYNPITDYEKLKETEWSIDLPNIEIGAATAPSRVRTIQGDTVVCYESVSNELESALGWCRALSRDRACTRCYLKDEESGDMKFCRHCDLTFHPGCAEELAVELGIEIPETSVVMDSTGNECEHQVYTCPICISYGVKPETFCFKPGGREKIIYPQFNTDGTRMDHYLHQRSDGTFFHGTFSKLHGAVRSGVLKPVDR